MKTLLVLLVALLCISAAHAGNDPSQIGIVPDSYTPPPEMFPGQFIPKVAVEDACAVESAFAKREATILAAGASPSSEIERVSPYYSQNSYELAHFEVIVSIIEFISKHPGITPAQAETATSAACFARAKNPRYYANLMPPTPAN